MASLRKFLAILLAVSFAVPLDAAPLRGRFRTRLRERQSTRQTQTPPVVKTQGFDPSVVREQIGGPTDPVVATASGINGGGIQPGGGGGEATSIGGGSPVSGTIVGNTGDVLGWSGSAWDDLTIQAAIVAGLGNGTDNYVITSDGAGGVAWEAAGGGTVTSPDGTTTTTRLPDFNVVDYGAAGDYRQSRTSGSTSAGTSVVLETGDGAQWSAGMYGVIPGAGAAHAWAAVTPTAPTVGNGGHTVFTASTTADLITVRDYQGSIANGQQVKLYGSSTLFTMAENQTVQFTGGPTGGNFTLTHNGNTTGAITFSTNVTTLAGNIQTALRLLTGLSAVTCTHNTGAFPSSVTFDVRFTGVSGDTPQMTSAPGGLTGGSSPTIVHATTLAGRTNPADGDSAYLRLGTQRNTFSVHPTNGDATGNTNAYDFDTAGAATMSFSLVGASTRSYRIVGLSKAGGFTVRSSATSTTTGVATPTVSSYDTVIWDPVSDGGSAYCQGYVIYGGTDDHYMTRINGAPNGMKVVMQAGGYTNCAPADIGKVVEYGGNQRGTLEWYDNATRTWIVKLDYDDGDTFPAASACTLAVWQYQVNGYAQIPYSTTSSVGEGAGTVTSSSYCYIWKNCGDTDFDYDYPTAVWRTGQEQQEIQISGSPSSGSYTLSWGGYQITLAYNASNATLQAALRTIPGLENVIVTTSGSTPNFTHVVTFQQDLGSGTERGLGDVPELKMRQNWSGGTPLFSVVTLVQGARAIPGQIILSAGSSSGTFQECVLAEGLRAGGASTPSFSATRNTYAADGKDVRWIRRDSIYPVTSPSAQANDVARFKVISKSTDTLTIDTDWGTGGNQSTTATVADDTPVFHDDLPAFQFAFAAAKAAKGGQIVAPAGHFSWFTRGADYSEWTAVLTGGNDQGVLFDCDSMESPIGFDLHGAEIFWRPLESCAQLDTTSLTTADDSDGQNIIALTKSAGFFWNNAKLVCAPAGEPFCEAEPCEHGMGFFVAASTNGEQETYARPAIRNSYFLIPEGLGSLYGTGVQVSPGATLNAYNCDVLYGSAGHDFATGGGEFAYCQFWGNTRRYASTCIYASLTYVQSPVRVFECDFYDVGADGAVRTFNPYLEWIGGSVNNTRDYDQATKVAYIQGPSEGNLGIGALVQGVKFNCYNDVLTCTAQHSKFTKCFFRNCGVSCGDDYINVVDNDFVGNEWTRRGNTSINGFVSVATGADNCNISLNTMTSEDVTMGTLASVGGQSCRDGIVLNSAATGTVIEGNILRTLQYPLYVGASYVGTCRLAGNTFYSYDLPSNQIGASIQPGNGAIFDYEGNTWDQSQDSDAITIQGTSSASHRFKSETFSCEVEVAAALTGVNSFLSCHFDDATNSTDFLDAGTIIRDCDFAIEPTCTGLTRSQSGNRVAGSLTKAVTLSASQNNYAWPTICDTILVDANAAYSITGIVPLAKGCVVKIVNVDSSDVLTLSHINAGSSAANKININAGSDLALGSLDGKEIIATGNGTAGWSEN